MLDFHVESWVWFGFAMAMVVLRFTARILHFKGVLRLQVEDRLMLFVASVYVALIVTLNLCFNTSSNLIDPQDIPTLTPDDIAERVYGSKMVLAVEQCMCAVQWGTKACLLVLYWRLTENIVQSLLVKGTAIYVASTYIVMEVLYFAVWCRPFHDYWQTPTDNVQCTTALHHLIVNLVFNLTSDILIMSIPLPLIVRAHLEFKKKVVLVLPFSLGFFSIICAILSKHLSFTHPFSSEWYYWYTREASTVMIVSNMPYTWGLVRKVFRVRSFFDNSHNTQTTHGSRTRTRTGEFDAELAGGVPELRGVPLEAPASAISTSGSDTGTDDGKLKPQHLFRIPSWQASRKGMERLESPVEGRDGLAPDVRGPSPNSPGDRPDDGADGNSSSSKSSRLSDYRRWSKAPSVTSPGMRPPVVRAPTDALDRMYRLGDDDLVADEEKIRKRSEAVLPD